MVVNTTGTAPPLMVSAWVPEPVPALVTRTEKSRFIGPGLESNIDMARAGRLPRVPGAAPGSQVVDLTGLMRRSERHRSNVRLEVWSDNEASLYRAEAELNRRA